MREVACPSCGGPVKFVSAVSLLAVCGYCRATLLCRDLDVERIGTMALLLEDRSPVQVGAEGRWRGAGFAVLGRIQVRWEHGAWNEWYCLFDDTRTGWLGEAAGEHTLTFEVGNAGALPPWSALRPWFAEHFRYAPWLVANLHCDAPPAPGAGAPLAWDNVLYDSASLGYVVATHQMLRSHPGATVLTYYRPFPAGPAAARRELLAASWAGLRDAVLADLARAHPDLAGLTRRLDVARYGHAMVRPEPGFVCGPALAAAGAALTGPVHLAHSDLSGFSLFEEAFDWGSRAAARLLARLGHARPATL